MSLVSHRFAWYLAVLQLFILGMIVGAALMLGSAYLHDTGAVRVGPPQAFVNWDTARGMLAR